LVAWIRSATGGSVVEALTRTPDGNVAAAGNSGSPAAVSTFSVSPAVALDATGRAIVVWAVVPSNARNAFRSAFGQTEALLMLGAERDRDEMVRALGCKDRPARPPGCRDVLGTSRWICAPGPK
jgi:hypothetical protein